MFNLFLFLSLFIWQFSFERTNSLDFTGEYFFEGNRLSDFSGETFTLWVCDDSQGDTGKVFISVWRFLNGGEVDEFTLPYAQAMGEGRVLKVTGNQIKVKGDASMTFRDNVVPSARFWIIYDGEDYHFTIKKMAKSALLTKRTLHNPFFTMRFRACINWRPRAQI